MAGTDATGEGDLPAGDFSSWLQEVQGAIRGEGTARVPCGDCTACCTSGQFVHIGPDETDTLAHIPRQLLFPAPGLPRGHVLLGYDERGRCPMLVDDRCSIYEHRPRTCRTYDCRIFPATGVDDDDNPLIAAQARRWRFDLSTDPARAAHQALRAAAKSLDGERNPTRRAVVAVEIHEAFLPTGEPPNR